MRAEVRLKRSLVFAAYACFQARIWEHSISLSLFTKKKSDRSILSRQVRPSSFSVPLRISIPAAKINARESDEIKEMYEVKLTERSN